MVAALKPDLEATAALLREPIATAERAFLGIGEGLGTTADLLGDLTATFDELPRVLEAEEVGAAAGHLRGVAAAAAAMAEGLTSERLALDRLATLNQTVTGLIARLRKTVGVINVLAINARIAATHIKAAGEDFSVFTSEIGRLGRAALDTIDGFAEEHERLVTLVLTAGANQAAFERSHKETLRTVADRLNANLASMNAHRHRAADRFDTIGNRSREITRGVGSAVVAMQIGDITRQRIEHVEQAIGTLLDGLTGRQAADSWSAPLSEDQQKRIIGAVCRLQAAQLTNAADDFDGELDRVVEVLDSLSADTQAIVALGGDIYGSTEAGGSFFGNLAAEIRTAESLMRECAAARRAVDEVASKVGATLGELLTRVRAIQAIEVDMRLVGLNTTLKCGRLGSQGRTLTVIAQELRTYANATVTDAHGVAAGLEAVAEAARALDIGAADALETGRIVTLDGQTAVAATTMETVESRLRDAILALRRDGERVTVFLRETSSGLGVRDAISGAVRNAIALLHRMVERAGTDPTASADIQERVKALLNTNYTMERERQIHCLLKADATIPAPACGGRAGAGMVAGPAAPAMAEDDIFF